MINAKVEITPSKNKGMEKIYPPYISLCQLVLAKNEKEPESDKTAPFF